MTQGLSTAADRRQRTFRWAGAAAAAAAVVCALCTSEQNPFADSSNARAVVLQQSGLADRDSVPLFTTRYLYVGVLVRELVDSFAVHAGANRHFADTVLHAPTTDDYAFAISFVDTGWQSVALTTFRSGGDRSRQDLRVRVYSPLRQPELWLTPDQPITFSTPGVGDTDVCYHWAYGGATLPSDTVRSRYPQASRKLDNLPSLLTGHLWVSDLRDSLRSPAVPFVIHTVDTVPPHIRGLNHAADRDTLRTSGDTLVFLVQVLDSGGVGNVTIADQTVAPIGPSVYRRIYTGLTGLAGALAVPVSAVDNSGNAAARTFSIVYDSTAQRLQNMSIVVGDPSPSTSRQSYPIVGYVLDNTHAEVTVSAEVNGVLDPDTAHVTISDSRGSFVLYVGLRLGANSVVLTARAPDGASTQATVTILYDENYQDRKAPVISEVRVGDRTVAENQSVTVRDSVPTVLVTAYDESGVASLLVNGTPAQPVAGKPYQWQAALHGLKYETPLVLRIEVTDSATPPNTRPPFQSYVLVNRMPSPAGAALPSLLLVGQETTAHLYVSDEADSVQVALLAGAPGGMRHTKVGSPNHWTMTWTPALADTGPHVVSLRLSDGAQDTVVAWQFTVAQAVPPPVRLADVPQFPVFLQATVDTLQTTLARRSGTGSLPLRFMVYVGGRGDTLLDTRAIMDSVAALRWVPAAADTGALAIVLKVSDGQSVDSLVRVVRVVPQNASPCSLSVVLLDSVPRTGAGELDMRQTTGTVRVAFVIHDQDHPYTERYTRTVTWGGTSSTVSLDSARTLLVALNRSSSRYRDTITVIVSDATGTSDTASVRVVYPSPMPRPSDTWVWPGRFIAGTSYAVAFALAEGEFAVTLSATNAPNGLVFVPDTGFNRWTITWTPSAADTGTWAVTLTLSDGLQDTAIGWAFDVLADSSRLVRLAIAGPDLPSFVEAGDTVRLALAAVQRTGKPPFRYTVRRTAGAAALLDTAVAGRGSAAFVWQPGAAEVGQQVLRMVVTDGYGDSDTLYRATEVVPANGSACSLSVRLSPGTDTTALGEIDMSAATGPDTVFFTIHDTDHPLTERYTVRITRDNATTVETLDSARSFSLIVGAVSSREHDTILVTVEDATGTRDTVMVRVTYARYHLVRINTTGSSGGAAVASTVTSFPLLVRLDSANFSFTGLPASRPPLRLEKLDGTTLRYEIEEWSPAARRAALWVLVDTVYGNNSTQALRLRVGGATASDTSSPSAVFDTANGFVGVWHMQETGATCADATARRYDGVRAGAVPAAGVIGGGQSFDGTGVRIEGPGSPQIRAAQTVSAWGNYRVLSPGLGNNILVSCGGATESNSDNFQYSLDVGQDRRPHMYWESGNGVDYNTMIATTAASFNLDSWHHFAAVRNPVAREVRFYVDGVQLGAAVSYTTGPDGGSAATIWFGAAQSGPTTWKMNGLIDEARIANVQRSAAWIKLCYETQKPGVTAVTVE